MERITCKFVGGVLDGKTIFLPAAPQSFEVRIDPVGRVGWDDFERTLAEKYGIMASSIRVEPIRALYQFAGRQTADGVCLYVPEIG